MTAISQQPFDSLQYAKELQAGGFTVEQSETLARVTYQEVYNNFAEKMVSREELSHITDKLVTREEFIDKFNELDTRIDHLDNRIDRLEHRVETLGMKLTIRLGSLMVIGITALGVMNHL